MASRNWSKFWWQDWQRDPALNLCSLEARGLWMDMLCIMADAEKKGFLIIGKTKVSSKELAQLSRISEKKCKKLVEELENNGVFSRDENGFIFSRRMVRDAGISRKSAENGKKGGNPALTQNGDGGLTPGLTKGLNPTRIKAEAEAEAEAEERINKKEKTNSLGAGKHTRPDWVEKFIPLGNEILEIVGKDPSRERVDFGIVRQWLADAHDRGYSAEQAREAILDVIRTRCERGSGKGKLPRWFNTPVQEALASGAIAASEATAAAAEPEWTRQMGKDYTLYARNAIGRQERPISMREFQTAWMAQHNIPQGEAA